jgi:4-hydroxy-4-methyl-2-oxoglutarate aldolase
MPETNIDRAIAELSALPTSWITDGMGRIGLHGGWLEGLTLRAGSGTKTTFVGRAMTIQWAPKQGRGNRKLTLYEIIRQRTDETILLIAGGPPHAYLFGDNTATAARIAGFQAILADGCVRDILGLPGVGIGVFSTAVAGGHPDTHEIVAVNVPILFRGQWVLPKDVVAADADGAVVFPADRAPEILQHALSIGEWEKVQRDVIVRNAPIEELHAVLQKKKQG